MMDLGLFNYYIGYEVMQREKSIFISKTKYISELLKKLEWRIANQLSSPWRKT